MSIKDKTGLSLLKDDHAVWLIPSNVVRLSVLVVGAGGGGAPGLGGSGGGGGAGGLVFIDNYLEAFGARPGDEIAVRVGLPVANLNPAQSRQGLPGEDSTFGKITALGGGGGGRGADEGHTASDGGSAGGGVVDLNETAAKALQPAKSGMGAGFGHPPGSGVAGAGGGGAGGPGTARGEGGGGSGLQGVPASEFVDENTGFVTAGFDPENPGHYRLLFQELFGPTFGDDGWFAGGGAHNAPYHEDEGGKGGGSVRDGLPHTGGGGGGSTHGHEGGRPGIGGSGVVLVRSEHQDGTMAVAGWGRFQPMEFLLRTPGRLLNEGNYPDALELLDSLPDKTLFSDQDRILLNRTFAQIYLGQGREKEAMEMFSKALELEENPNS